MRHIANSRPSGPQFVHLLRAHDTWVPNLLMVAGPQSVSGSTNSPRAIESGVDWLTDFLEHVRSKDGARFEAREEAEKGWGEEVIAPQERMLMRRSRGWFTDYNANVEGHEEGVVRYLAYWGAGTEQ
jgi:hypothetical protein